MIAGLVELRWQSPICLLPPALSRGSPPTRNANAFRHPLLFDIDPLVARVGLGVTKQGVDIETATEQAAPCACGQETSEKLQGRRRNLKPLHGDAIDILLDNDGAHPTTFPELMVDHSRAA